MKVYEVPMRQGIEDGAPHSLQSRARVIDALAHHKLHYQREKLHPQAPAERSAAIASAREVAGADKDVTTTGFKLAQQPLNLFRLVLPVGVECDEGVVVAVECVHDRGLDGAPIAKVAHMRGDRHPECFQD